MRKINTIQDFQKLLFRYTMVLFIIFLGLFFTVNLTAQVIITGGPQYTQDFGNTDITTWTNNSTFTGWYSTITTINHQNVTAAAPSNTGGFYSYECNGDNNQKIGTRPSNATPGAVGSYIRYGVRFVNNSGFPIVKIRVKFTAYQLSLAENNGTINQLEFHYRTSTTAITDLTSGTYTSVPALWYTAPNNHPGPGTSNQVSGYPCTVNADLEACITLATPLANNDEIMLRWSDRNDSNNDPHLAIDDVIVWFFPDHADNTSACNTALPLEWLYFNLQQETNQVVLNWGTASESNVSHFEVQKRTSNNDFVSIAYISATNIQHLTQHYSYTDINPIMNEINYYRIKQVDWNGAHTYTNILAAELNAADNTFWHYQLNGQNYLTFYSILNQEIKFEIFDVAGRLLDSKQFLQKEYTQQIHFTPGIYIVTVYSDNKSVSKKIIIH